MSAVLKMVTKETEVAIHTRALKVSLGVSTWTARKYDKAVTKQATAANGASADAGRFNKMLIPSDSITYKALMQHVGSVRTEHYAQTLAWSDEGWRLLSNANFEHYSDFVRKAQHTFRDLLEDFLKEYPKMRAAAPARLGAMYKEDDFPTVEQIRGKFGFYLTYAPLPAQGDFRLDLPQSTLDELERASEASIRSATEGAMRDAWGRLYTCVAHIKERLSNPEGIFRDTLISNARELCEILGRLNVVGDPNLDAMCQEVTDYIAYQDPDTIREDSEVRESIATLADDIVSRMSAFYSPEEN